MRYFFASVGTFLALTLGASSVYAAEPAPEATPATASYGWQIAIVDPVIVAGTITTSAALDDDGKFFYIAGPTMWTLGAPILHLAHGNVRGAAISFGLRGAVAGLTALGAYAGATSSCRGDFCNFGMVAGSLMLGGAAAVAVSIVDGFLLAKEPAPRRASAASISPDLAIGPSAACVGVVGTF